MILWHGTSKSAGKAIMKNGFSVSTKSLWKHRSQPGFIYLTTAYAPFFAMAQNPSTIGAIIKVEVDKENLYPDEDFLFYADLLKKPAKDNKHLDRYNKLLIKLDWEKTKQFAPLSLTHMGTVCCKPKNIKILGIRYFDVKKLFLACDPVISPQNYKVLGGYYRSLTEHIFNTGTWEGHTSINDFFMNQATNKKPASTSIIVGKGAV